MIENTWTNNIILVDADHIDKVAFDLIVNFERIIGRRIPQADMARWLECVALDGGMRPSDESKQTAAENKQADVQVVLIYNKDKKALDNFTPGNYVEELNGKAFNGALGEFVISAVPVEEMTTKEDLFTDMLKLALGQKEVKRLMIIPSDSMFDGIASVLRKVDDDEKRITVLSMEPKNGGAFRQEILGYSLISALGIRSDEIPHD